MMPQSSGNEQLAYAVEAAELATWDYDPATQTFTGNARLKEWFGLDKEENILLESAVKVIAEKDRERVSRAIARALDFSSGGLYEIEYTLVHPTTGQERIIRAKGKTLFNKANEAVRFNGILMDITNEMFALEQRQKLLKLVENSVDLMSILELNGVNSYINRAGREILGIDADADVTRIPITDFHTPEQIAFVEKEIIPNVMGQGKWAGAFAIKNQATGEIIPLYNNCHRIDDIHTGQPIGIGAVMRDMRPELNARKELEEKVKERTRELQAANDQLEKKNQELASFAYVSSHDLQEPLRKIRTFTERIKSKEYDRLSETGQDFFVRIDKAAERMQLLINDLLDFSRVDTRAGVPVETDMNDLLLEVMTDLREDIDAKKAVVNKPDLGTANVVAFQFRQLLSNVIGNALKFSKPDTPPVIDITCSIVPADVLPGDFVARHDCYYKLSIADNGIGFEPQYAERIFELFQRLHGRQEYAGTGIGLAIVQKIVHNHGGLVRAFGDPGNGARFDLYIPHNAG